MAEFNVLAASRGEHPWVDQDPCDWCADAYTHTVTFSAGGLIIEKRHRTCNLHLTTAVLAHPRKTEDLQVRRYGHVSHAIVTPRIELIQEEDDDDD